MVIKWNIHFHLSKILLIYKDTLHGGMISSLTDSVSTLALETNEKKPTKSASIELSVS